MLKGKVDKVFLARPALTALPQFSVGKLSFPSCVYLVPGSHCPGL